VLCWFLWVLFWDEELACPLFSLPFLLGNLKIRGQDDILLLKGHLQKRPWEMLIEVFTSCQNTGHLAVPIQ